MDFKNFEDFKKIIDIDFLNKNIWLMITYNIPFPHSFIRLLNNVHLQNSVNAWYIAKTFENQLFFDSFRHARHYISDWEDWYEIEYKILMDYITKIPRFKKLIKRM